MTTERDDLGRVIEISDSQVMALEPVVSVYMSTYNHAEYLAQAIEGVRAQRTTFPIELVIGEDCSTDRTREIAIEYQQRHPDLIRIITGPENLGSRRNARRTLGRVRGEFVAFCEGDDWWCHPDKLQRQVEILRENPAIGVVHGAFQRAEFRGGGWMTSESPPRPAPLSGHLFSRIFSEYPMQTCTVLYRREVIEAFRASEFDRPEYLSGDTALSAFCCASWEVGFLDEVVSTYRISPGSMTRSGYPSMHRFTQSLTSLYEHFRRVYGDREDFDVAFGKVIYRRAVDTAFRAGDEEAFQKAVAVLGERDPSALSAPGLRFRRLVIRSRFMLFVVLGMLESRLRIREWAREWRVRLARAGRRVRERAVFVSGTRG